MNNDSLPNRLGALALALTDAQAAAARRVTGLGPSAAAVIATLGVTPGAAIVDLARVAGVTHSVMVRTVEALRREGLVERRADDDGRRVALVLTVEGARMRTAMLDARATAVAQALAALPAAGRAALAPALDAMLAALTSGREGADHLCRLCDEDACGAGCPVERRARRIEADAP